MGFERTPRMLASKARAELAELEAQGVVTKGNAFSSVLIVKGEMGEAELRGEGLLSGADGVALRAALAKLGYAPEDWCALACWRNDGGFLTPDQMRLALATLDPATVIACDSAAQALLCDALSGGLLSLEVGRVNMLHGIRVLCLGGFEAALASMPSKQLMWARLKQIPPLGEPY